MYHPVTMLTFGSVVKGPPPHSLGGGTRSRFTWAAYPRPDAGRAANRPNAQRCPTGQALAPATLAKPLGALLA